MFDFITFTFGKVRLKIRKKKNHNYYQYHNINVNFKEKIILKKNNDFLFVYCLSILLKQYNFPLYIQNLQLQRCFLSYLTIYNESKKYIYT